MNIQSIVIDFVDGGPSVAHVSTDTGVVDFGFISSVSEDVQGDPTAVVVDETTSENVAAIIWHLL